MEGFQDEIVLEVPLRNSDHATLLSVLNLSRLRG
jgi:hypothetical protein